MSTFVALPRSLHDKLQALARHLRWRRALHGGSLLLVVLLVPLSAALVADYCLGLPPGVRLAFLLVWAGRGMAAALFRVLLPLCRRLSLHGLAALIEERYPDLGECLTSAVELAASQGNYHGAPTLVALLMEETERRARTLNFAAALPARHTARWAGAAATVLLLAGLCALVWPRYSFELGRRFLLPWRTPGALVFYSLEVAPGNTTAAKGRPLAFSVTIVPEHDQVALPQTATLVINDAAGVTSRHLLGAARPHAFAFVLDRVNGSFTYHIEAGAASSATYQVTAIEPVELAADSPTIVITPPAYARNTFEEQTIHGLADLAVLQYSRMRFQCRFTRPARAACLEWPRPALGAAKAKGSPAGFQPLLLTADHCGASCELPALTGGSYRLILEEEHGICTELEPRTLTVHVDQPPAFGKVIISDKVYVGLDQSAEPAQEHRDQSSAQDEKTMLASESLPVSIAVTDDVGVERAELEYRINDSGLQRELIRLAPAAGREARGQILFPLAGRQLRAGDTLRYRICAADNRNLPEVGLGPNVIHYPPDQRWLTVRIAAKGQPLRQQEILAQRDDIGRRLKEIKDRLLQAQGKLKRLRSQAQQQTGLEAAQMKQLQQLRNDNRAAENSLRDLARAAAAIEPLQSLADQARAIADQELRRSAAALQRAEQELQPQPRDQRFHDSEKAIAAALDRVEDLRRANGQLAQTRLDLANLEWLSDRQQQLAERATREAAQEPGSPNRDQELKRDQKAIANDLQRLAERSEQLRQALDAARAEEARTLASRAQELAQAERDLVEAERQRPRREQASCLAELARQQQRLAEQAGKVAKLTRAAAQTAGTVPLRLEAADQAAQALGEDNLGEAVRLQQQNRVELARLAQELDQARERARQPREAARQLARLQEALRQNLNEQGSKEPATANGLEAVGREQQALSRAVQKLPIPAGDSSAEKQQREAEERTTQALEALESHNARHAAVRMAQAVQALEQLAERLPAESEPSAQNERPDAAPATVRGQAAESAPAPEGLPSAQQANQLRELARQQRQLSAAVQELLSQEGQAQRGPRANPARELEREQKEIARQAAALARTVNQEYGPQASATLSAQQAAQSARDASRYLQAGAMQPAYRAGTQTARELSEVADRLGQSAEGNPRSTDTREQARRVGQRQEEVNRRMAALVADPDAQQAQQQARQQELEQRTSTVRQDLSQLAQQMADSPLARLSAQRAAESAEQAQAAMKQARANDREGNRRQAAQAQQQAALDLDLTAGQAEMAAQQLAAARDLPQGPAEPAQSAAQSGRALQAAEREMSQAQTQVGQGQHQAALQAMQRAAQALQQAARQLAAAGSQTKSAGPTIARGAGQAGGFDPSLFSSDAREYAGKRWGELPGELRTRIIQDMQARYGEDYARIIKFYFEQIADTRKRAN